MRIEKIPNPMRVLKPLDREQREYLNTRLREFGYSYKNDREPDPQFVRAARKIIRAWENRQERLRSRVERRHEKLVRKVREEMLFGDPRKALAMVRTFQK
jgi:hypothetical protein